jgi:DUF1680 family protein
MWMRHPEGGLVAQLYGPCTVSTQIEGTAVSIEERTLYPFEHKIEVTIRLERACKFELYFRNPCWSKATRVVSAGAKIEREGDYWRVLKRWNSGDTVHLAFTPEVRELPAVNGEVAIGYGALIFSLPLASKRKSLKQYNLADFEDSIYEPAFDSNIESDLPAAQRAKAFEVRHRPEGGNPLRPFDFPLIELHGHLISRVTNTRKTISLVPLGNAPLLRRTTFRIFG